MFESETGAVLKIKESRRNRDDCFQNKPNEAIRHSRNTLNSHDVFFLRFIDLVHHFGVLVSELLHFFFSAFCVILA